MAVIRTRRLWAVTWTGAATKPSGQYDADTRITGELYRCPPGKRAVLRYVTWAKFNPSVPPPANAYYEILYGKATEGTHVLIRKYIAHPDCTEQAHSNQYSMMVVLHSGDTIHGGISADLNDTVYWTGHGQELVDMQ